MYSVYINNEREDIENCPKYIYEFDVKNKKEKSIQKVTYSDYSCLFDYFESKDYVDLGLKELFDYKHFFYTINNAEKLLKRGTFISLSTYTEINSITYLHYDEYDGVYIKKVSKPYGLTVVYSSRKVVDLEYIICKDVDRSNELLYSVYFKRADFRNANSEEFVKLKEIYKEDFKRSRVYRKPSEPRKYTPLMVKRYRDEKMNFDEFRKMIEKREKEINMQVKKMESDECKRREEIRKESKVDKNDFTNCELIDIDDLPW